MRNLYQAVTDVNRLEQLAMEDSPIHRVHPMAKLITSIAYIVLVISFPSWNVSGLVPFLLFPVILTSLSGTPYRPLWGRLLIALPFSLMGGVSNLIMSRDTAFYIGEIAISQGMLSFSSIMLKTLLSLFAVLILMATTTFVEIGYQLALLRVPKMVCLQFVMTYRFLSVLASETGSMFTAYSLRAPNQKGIRIRDVGGFLGQLIMRSSDRADHIYQAMKCRGFQGTYYGKKRGGFRVPDVAYLVVSILAMVVLRFFNLSEFLGGLFQKS